MLRRSSVLLALLVGSLFAATLALPRRSVAENARMNVRIYESGETRVWEVAPTADSVDESLANLAYAWGAAQWRLEPMLTMLQLVISSEDGSSGLNVEEMDRLIGNPPERYRSVIAQALPLTFRVDADGTHERIVVGPPQLEDIRRSIARLGVLEEARTVKAISDPVNVRLLERWLHGAQKMAQANEELFYAQNPIFRSSRLVESFRMLTVQNLIEFITLRGKLYDVTGMVGILSAVPNWIDSRPLGTSARVSRATSATENLSSFFSKFGRATPVGASNGASLSIGGECITQGEPHQPYSDLTRAKVFQIFPRTRQGTVTPALFMTQGASPTPMLSFSPFHSTSGTAGPSFPGLLFFSETDGARYLRFDGQWAPLANRTVTYRWAGEERSFTVHSVPGFGEVFARFLQPNTGTQFAITFRSKTITSGLDGMFNRLRFGVGNKEANYKNTVVSGGLQYYGEAGCHPAPAGSPRAYAALNQGRTDQLVDESDSPAVSFLPALARYQKTGSHDTPACFNQPWSTSDNGTLRAGCATPPHLPDLLDPGIKTFRQLQFKRWAEGLINRPQNDPEAIFRFFTGTGSDEAKRIAQLLGVAIANEPPTVRTTNEREDLLTFGELLQSYDGVVHDAPLQLQIFYALKKVQKLDFPGPILQKLLPAISPTLTDVEAQALVDAELGAALVQTSLDAITFYREQCLAKGIVTWSHAVQLALDGVTIPLSASGPSASEARSMGYLDFKTVSGQPQCAVVMTSSSPFSFIASGAKVQYRTFGSPVSPFTVEPQLYNKSTQFSVGKLSEINRAGTGASDSSAFQTFYLDRDWEQPAPGPELTTYALSLVFTSRADLQKTLTALRKKVTELKGKPTTPRRRAVGSRVTILQEQISDYLASSVRFETHSAIEAGGKAVVAAATSARKSSQRKIKSNCGRALQRIKKLVKIIGT